MDESKTNRNCVIKKTQTEVGRDFETGRESIKRQSNAERPKGREEEIESYRDSPVSRWRWRRAAAAAVDEWRCSCGSGSDTPTWEVSPFLSTEAAPFIPALGLGRRNPGALGNQWEEGLCHPLASGTCSIQQDHPACICIEVTDGKEKGE